MSAWADSAARVSTRSAGDSAPGARGTVSLGSSFPFEYLRSCVCASKQERVDREESVVCGGKTYTGTLYY